MSSLTVEMGHTLLRGTDVDGAVGEMLCVLRGIDVDVADDGTSDVPWGRLVATKRVLPYGNFGMFRILQTHREMYDVFHDPIFDEFNAMQGMSPQFVDDCRREESATAENPCNADPSC